jgi:hypothetical protein
MMGEPELHGQQWQLVHTVNDDDGGSGGASQLR